VDRKDWNSTGTSNRLADRVSSIVAEAYDYFKITEGFSFQFDSAWIESIKVG
jgi:hypothetical protein